MLVYGLNHLHPSMASFSHPVAFLSLASECSLYLRISYEQLQSKYMQLQEEHDAYLAIPPAPPVIQYVTRAVTPATATFSTVAPATAAPAPPPPPPPPPPVGGMRLLPDALTLCKSRVSAITAGTALGREGGICGRGWH